MEWLPQDMANWHPVAQSVCLGLLTFISEDAATVGAALLAAGGVLSWPVGFWGCFLGIWMGDAGLYLLARSFGRKLLQLHWAKRLVKPDRIHQSEEWFSRKGPVIVVMCRMFPGTRLPTYLAAGLLRLKFSLFLVLTGLAALIWTAAIFWLSHLMGESLLDYLERYRWGGWAMLAALALVMGAIRLLLVLARPDGGRRMVAAVQRWRRWEFWPAWLFYAPVAAWCLWLMIKYRGISLPTLANPGIRNGGLVGESKMETLSVLARVAPGQTVSSFLIHAASAENRVSRLNELMDSGRIRVPFILKPDIGQRGNGVRLVKHRRQAEEYLAEIEGPVVAQAYSEGPEEAGIFYHRFPGREEGEIFAITRKEFPSVTGDGRRTVEQLIRDDPRAFLIAEKYLARFHDRTGDILAAGETLKLVVAGNHAQGCVFRDGKEYITPQLTAVIDRLSKTIPGFYIGRFDIRYREPGDLEAGRFDIIELNGAAAEATNIYDERNALRSAYRTLFQQWELVFAIGAENRRRGCSSTSVRQVWSDWLKYQRLARTYPRSD